MKIIFLGTTGVHQALVAGYYYLGFRPEGDCKNLNGFADLEMEICGFPILLGQDQKGNMVYALGCETDVLMMKKTIEQLADILGNEPNQLLVLPISIPGEKMLLWLTNIAGFTGAGKWYSFISRFIVKKNLLTIFNQVKQLQQQFIRN
ncbi:MAG: DUF3189 family protein [Syntrophomonadaceae bacterium]|nr:DUF3189 family protein [Syntrophomonadaceae bacterium]